jgi:hypothetical protein
VSLSTRCHSFSTSRPAAGASQPILLAPHGRWPMHPHAEPPSSSSHHLGVQRMVDGNLRTPHFEPNPTSTAPALVTRRNSDADDHARMKNVLSRGSTCWQRRLELIIVQHQERGRGKRKSVLNRCTGRDKATGAGIRTDRRVVRPIRAASRATAHSSCRRLGAGRAPEAEAEAGGLQRAWASAAATAHTLAHAVLAHSCLWAGMGSRRTPAVVASL